LRYFFFFESAKFINATTSTRSIRGAKTKSTKGDELPKKQERGARPTTRPLTPKTPLQKDTTHPKEKELTH
jgi:hypothetical protein